MKKIMVLIGAATLFIYNSSQAQTHYHNMSHMIDYTPGGSIVMDCDAVFVNIAFDVKGYHSREYLEEVFRSNLTGCSWASVQSLDLPESTRGNVSLNLEPNNTGVDRHINFNNSSLILTQKSTSLFPINYPSKVLRYQDIDITFYADEGTRYSIAGAITSPAITCTENGYLTITVNTGNITGPVNLRLLRNNITYREFTITPYVYTMESEPVYFSLAYGALWLNAPGGEEVYGLLVQNPPVTFEEDIRDIINIYNSGRISTWRHRDAVLSYETRNVAYGTSLTLYIKYPPNVSNASMISQTYLRATCYEDIQFLYMSQPGGAELKQYLLSYEEAESSGTTFRISLNGSQMRVKYTLYQIEYKWGERDLDVVYGTDGPISFDRAVPEGTYRVKAEVDGMREEMGSVTVENTWNLDDSKNWVMTHTFYNGERHTNIDYYYPLGMPEQSIAMPGGRKDKAIVNFHNYDDMGRESISYLPFVADTTYVDNPFYRQQEYYRGVYTDDNDVNYTFSSNVFDQSPLGLMIQSGGVGETGYNYPVVYDYGRNGSSYEIKKFRIAADNTSLEFVGYYNEGELTYSMMQAPENGQNFKWVNSWGQVIADEYRNSATDRKITYNVYDEIGYLRYCIPSIEETGINTPGVYSLSSLRKYCFYYEYDSCGRPYKTYPPGSDYQVTVYDNRDRPVMSQTGKMRQYIPERWMFLKYDNLNRQIMSGVISGGTYEQHAAALQSQTAYGENKGGNIHGYTNETYPYIDSESDVLNVTYYDDYSWVNDPSYDFPRYPHYPTPKSTDIVGLPTGTKTKVLGIDEDKWLTGVTYYDEKYNSILSITDLYPFGSEYLWNTHDMEGNVTESMVAQTIDGISYDKYLDYDEKGRLKSVDQQIFNDQQNRRVTLAAFEYDDMGRITKKLLHNGGLDTVVYDYRVSGMNHSQRSGSFSYSLGFDRSLIPGKEGYTDGKLSQFIWKNPNETAERAYHFNYDQYGRLISSSLYENNGLGWTATDARKELASYDVNGNTRGISRQGVQVEGPEGYDFSYDGNLLTTVRRIENGNLLSREYSFEYDADGNMVYDENAGVRINYNILGLPERIFSTTGNEEVNYIYDATGNKLAAVSSGSATYYCYPMVYSSQAGSPSAAKLMYIEHPEGIIAAANGNYEYRYFLKDHLGSTRAVIARTGSNRVIQATDYYPFGMPWETNDLHINKYLFSGKEYLDASVGSLGSLGLYDFHARWYNPRYGRWFNQDPAYQGLNPYIYCGNSPGMYVDPDGEFFFTVFAAMAGASKFLSALALTVDIAMFTGGMRGIDSGRSFMGGAWRGGVTGVASFGLGMVGGAELPLIADIGLGVAEGTLSSLIDGVLWNDISGKSILQGAVRGGSFAFITSSNFSNFSRGQRFRSNGKVFQSFIDKGDYQGVLDYFGVDGIFDPEWEGWEKAPLGAAGVHPKTGDMYFREGNAFDKGYGNFKRVIDHEKFHQTNVRSGKYASYESITKNMRYLEEVDAHYRGYKRQGLYYYKSFKEVWTDKSMARYYVDMYDGDIIRKFVNNGEIKDRWYEFLYRIPRRY